jgi:hypothetical protein
MPRILSRPELFPQVKHSYVLTGGSRSSFAPGVRAISPTISALPSASLSKTRCAGISYKIHDRRRDESPSRDDESRGDTNGSWGYFVDFNSPQYSVEQRKSSLSLPLIERSDASR